MLAVLISLACYAASAASEVLPELRKHLDFGQHCLESGQTGGALACTELILLPRLRVFVQPGSGQLAVAQAMATWSSALGGAVKFVAVSKPSEAQVTVAFATQLGSGSSEYGGFTKWKRRLSTSAWSLAATMQIRTVTPSGDPMTLAQMRNAAVHEFGHVLGLDDSALAGEVMAPLDLARPVSAPSKSEIATLMRLRQEALSLRSQALAANR